MRPRSRILLYIILTLWALFILFPIYWTVVTSLKTPEDVILGPKYIPWVDFKPTLQNYRNVYIVQNTTKYLVNSVVASVVSTFFALIFGSMAAYGLSRFQYKFAVMRNNDIFMWIVSQRMMPPIVSVLALFIVFHSIKILDTRLALIIAYVTFNLPIVVWLMRSFMDQVPKTIEEAAQIDGASYIQVLFRIVLPTIVPGIIASSLLCMIFAWNEFLFALILSFNKAQTMPLLIAFQRTQEAIKWWNISSLTVIAILPVLIMFLLLQKFFLGSRILGWEKD
jgi:multiple sugar transport system permease protein